MLSKYVKIPIVVLCLVALAIPLNVQSAPDDALLSPYPGAPLCPTHDDKAYHGLWDSVRGCHYDHTHNDDPAIANSVFGPAGAAWGGQTISYPWMTTNENDGHGHSGYKYYVNLNPQPACANEGYEYLGTVNCVTAFRFEYHDAGGNAHLVKRFHSYYMEVQIKRGNTVGYIKTGGWADFGCLHGSYKEFFIPLPGIDPVGNNGQTRCRDGGQSIHSDPYRAPNKTYQEVLNGQFDDNGITWTSHDEYGYNKLGFFFFRTLDSWGALDPNDPYTEHFICPDFRCKYNNSEHNVFNVFVMIPSSLDTDRDGIVNYTGYTNVKGDIVQGCTAPGPECVPLQIFNAPVGDAIWSRNLSGLRPAGDPIRDHDIYFNGRPSGWIQFNSHVYDSPVSTNTPQATSTHPSSDPFVSTAINPINVTVGETALVSVKLNNVPVEGYKSAEFTCTYDINLLEKSNVAAANLFGSEPVVAIHDVQNGMFIVALAGTNSNRATTSGPAFTFSVKGLQSGQSQLQCTARVSKGDNVPITLQSTGANLTVSGFESSPTPFDSPTSTPSDHQHSTATNTPSESPTLTSTPSPNGSVSGQVIASKPVTVSLLDASNLMITEMIVNPDGTFNLTPLAGNYTLRATANGFLSHQGSVTIISGNTVVLPAVSLLAGDIDGNNVIDQFDALTIGMNYTSATPTAADLNTDGAIDFLDLELLAENYRITGPSVW